MRERTYGDWQKGEEIPEDKTQCIESIFKEAKKGIYPIAYQCTRKRGHGTRGLFCKHHAKNHGKLTEIKLSSILNSGQDMTYSFKIDTEPHMRVSTKTQGNATLELMENATVISSIVLLNEKAIRRSEMKEEYILKSNTLYTIKLTSDSDYNQYQINIEYIEDKP